MGGHGENDQPRRKSLLLSLLSSRPKMRGALSSTFRPSFLSCSYQRPEDGLGSDEAECLVER
jgi:hypothetical protein